VVYRFVQAQHAQLFANHRRPSAAFVPADKCDRHVEFFRETFACE